MEVCVYDGRLIVTKNLTNRDLIVTDGMFT